MGADKKSTAVWEILAGILCWESSDVKGTGA